MVLLQVWRWRDMSFAALARRICYSKNKLTYNQATIETDTTGLMLASTGTIARSTAQAAHGLASCLVTGTASGCGVGTHSSYLIPAVAGAQWTAVSSCYIGNTGRNISTKLRFYDSGKAQLGSTNTSTGVVSSAAWVQTQVTAVAPANTAYVGMFVTFNDAGTQNGDTFYADKLGLWLGSSTGWVAPVR